MVASVPSSKSPLAVVVILPLLADVPFPVAAAVTSMEFDVATPEYSKIANRKGPETVCEMVMVSGPSLMFSA